MKLIFLVLSFFLFFLFVAGQTNLVPNPSFEDTVYCPYNYDLLEAAVDWVNPTLNTPDYFHPCAPDWVVNFVGPSVPLNAVGYEPAHSGNSYAGFGTKRILKGTDQDVVAEYLACQLDSTLIAGQLYCVDFFLSLSDSCIQETNHIGIYFYPQLIDEIETIERLDFLPQFETGPDIISERFGWTHFSGTVVLEQDCQYMMIGRFAPELLGDFIDHSFGKEFPQIDYMAYYYLDDVSVRKCAVGIEHLEFEQINFTNPQGLKTFCDNEKDLKQVSLFSSVGALIGSGSMFPDSIHSDYLASGFYFFQIQTTKGKTISGKVQVLR